MIGVGLSIVQLAVRQLLGFNPTSLFAAGEQGAWYDPSDMSTLFQDAVGTTPVTAVEQAVGRMLDKSKGLVLGPELIDTSIGPLGDARVTRGTTETASNGYWKITTQTLSGSVGVTVSTSDTALSDTPKTYKVIADVASIQSTAPLVFRIGGAHNLGIGASPNVINITSPGLYTFYVLSGIGLDCLNAILGYGAVAAVGDTATFKVSIKELPGNHATQSTAANRPVLSARYNLLTKTEQFNDAAW